VVPHREVVAGEGGLFDGWRGGLEPAVEVDAERLFGWLDERAFFALA
jgi:hypothetical protein